MKTDSADVESCDLRLGTVYENEGELIKNKSLDVVFFRFGYFQYLKMNLVNMVKKFDKDIWYHINLLMDWN